MEDESPAVKKSISEVIGALSELLVPNKDWNELFEFIYRMYQQEEADSISSKELSLLLLSVIIEYLPKDDIKVHFDDMQRIIVESLESNHSSLKQFGIKALTNIASSTTNVKVLKNF